jgi:hypothetical protein
MTRFAVLALLCLAVAATAGNAGATSTLISPNSANLHCSSFRNTPLVVEFARKTLIYNGFHPNIQFTCLSGNIFFLGVVDGEEYQGAVTRLGTRKIRIGIVEHPASPPGRALYTDSSTFNLPFNA